MFSAAGGAGVGVSVSASSDSELGKRKNRWEDDYGNNGGPRTGRKDILQTFKENYLLTFAVGLMKKQKVYVPVRKYPDTNFIGFIIHISYILIIMHG